MSIYKNVILPSYIPKRASTINILPVQKGRGAPIGSICCTSLDHRLAMLSYHNVPNI